MNTITQDTLIRKHGKEKGLEAFAEIAKLGGFGEVGPAEGQLDPDSTLDVGGVLDPENKAVSASAKNRITELLGTSAPEPKADAKK
jgi:hypothetical protein